MCFDIIDGLGKNAHNERVCLGKSYFLCTRDSIMDRFRLEKGS